MIRCFAALLVHHTLKTQRILLMLLNVVVYFVSALFGVVILQLVLLGGVIWSLFIINLLLEFAEFCVFVYECAARTHCDFRMKVRAFEMIVVGQPTHLSIRGDSGDRDRETFVAECCSRLLSNTSVHKLCITGASRTLPDSHLYLTYRQQI